MAFRRDLRHVDGLIPTDVGVPVSAVARDIAGVRARRELCRAGEHQVLEEVREAPTVRGFIGSADVVPDLGRHHGHAPIRVDGDEQAVREALGNERGRVAFGSSGGRERNDRGERDQAFATGSCRSLCPAWRRPCDGNHLCTDRQDDVPLFIESGTEGRQGSTVLRVAADRAACECTFQGSRTWSGQQVR